MAQKIKKGTPLWKALLLEHRLPMRYNKYNWIFYFKYGIVNGIKLFYLRSINFNLTSKKLIWVKLPIIKYKIALRKEENDIRIFEQVFINNEFQFPIKFEPSIIVDCGANIGLTAIYFLNRFPNAYLIAIEPELSNFNILKKNLFRYNCKLIKSAVWDRSTYVKIKNKNVGKASFEIEECKRRTPSSFKALNINDLLKKLKKRRIDILKIDIEGAEKKVFSRNYKQWLNKTNIVVIELHEAKAKGVIKILNNIIQEYKFKKIRRGEHIILYKNKNSLVS